jgi:hypothetical protein
MYYPLVDFSRLPRPLREAIVELNRWRGGFSNLFLPVYYTFLYSQ